LLRKRMNSLIKRRISSRRNRKKVKVKKWK
jgi:hypothetical protein